ADPARPKVIGRIGTGWYPAAVAGSPEGRALYVASAKGIGEDPNPRAPIGSLRRAAVESAVDADLDFGTGALIRNLRSISPQSAEVMDDNFHVQPAADTSAVPVRLGAASPRIEHVIFILKENKTFDSMFGSDSHYGPFAATTFFGEEGNPETDDQ